MIIVATLIVLADEGESKIKEESDTDSNNTNDKKGDSKGSGKVEGSTNSKEGSGPTPVSGSDADAKNKQDGEGTKRLVLFAKWFMAVFINQLRRHSCSDPPGFDHRAVMIADYYYYTYWYPTTKVS